MRLWCIASDRHRALDGEGAQLWGGRWNSPGRPVVYTSATASLAALEKLAWIDPDEVPEDLRLFEIELPDNLVPQITTLTKLPADWPEVGSRACIDIGDQWLSSRASLALAVPSALLPEEQNVLVNPLHRQAERVHVVNDRPFASDLRLVS